ncbi:hypothetical protein Glove_194g70 [Diversispora epigaea]|uniref:Uncharacterized protein n=1 Tax=Diversispora epigaea TaxID=1348612 RepID=A0A397IL75_9GLOM|nr:hypothetical protein Glove_194g70 [Diversispora epigaea]
MGLELQKMKRKNFSDDEKVFKWYSKSAKGGNSYAQISLGKLKKRRMKEISINKINLDIGIETPKDYEETF